MTGWKEIIVWEFYDAKQNLHGSKYVGELIRCKDCRHNLDGSCEWHYGTGYRWNVDDDDYCSCAERKEE